MQILGGKQSYVCNQTLVDCNQTKARASNWCLPRENQQISYAFFLNLSLIPTGKQL